MFLALLIATQSKLGLQPVLLLPHSSRLYLVVAVATDLKPFPFSCSRKLMPWQGARRGGWQVFHQEDDWTSLCSTAGNPHCCCKRVSGVKGPPGPPSQHLPSLIPCVLQLGAELLLLVVACRSWCVLIFVLLKKKRMLSFQTCSCQDKMIAASFSPVPLLDLCWMFSPGLWNTEGNVWIWDWGWRFQPVPGWNPLSAHSLQLWNYRCESFTEFSGLLKARSVDFSGAALNCLCRVEL